MKRIVLLLFALGLSACVSNSDFDRMKSDVHELQKNTYESKKDIDSLREKTTGIVKEDSFAAVRESQADLFAKITETSSSLQELRGRFDENRYFTEKALKEFSAEKELLRAQIAGLEAQVKSLRDRMAILDGGGKPAETAKESVETVQKPADPVKPEGGAQAETVTESKTKAYDTAYQLFKDKKYKESREKLEAFIREYPKTDLTDNAQFWIAEAYYAEKDFENAILAYETLLKKYPESDKASGGMLKQAFAFAELGDIKTGKIIYNRLIEKYPDSKDAEVAKKKIAELEKKPVKKR